MIAAIISFGILFAGYVMNAMLKLYMVTGHGELELDSAFTDILQKANIDTQADIILRSMTAAVFT